MTTDIAVQHALDRLAKRGFEALSETDKTLAAAWLFDAGVSNDGFAKYYSGKRGDLAFHAPVALRLIGAMQLAGIAEEANAVFGPGGPPPDGKTRRDRVNALAPSARHLFADLETRFFDSDEDIDDLLEAFLAGAKR